MLGDNLKRLRMKAGLTQKALAEAIGSPLPTLHGWEQGRRTPNIETLRKLANALGTTIDELTADKPTAPPAKKKSLRDL